MAKTSKVRVAPTLTAVRDDIPMPDRKVSRGSKSIYNFDALKVGQSFGIMAKQAKSMSSIISNQNKKSYRAVNGNDPLFHMTKNGELDVPTSHPLMYHKVFAAVDVDPKKDPDKASCRVFRLPDETIALPETAPAAPAAPNKGTPVPPPAS